MDADAIWWWAWCRNQNASMQTFFDAFHKVKHMKQELCHWSQHSRRSRIWKRLLISTIKTFIFNDSSSIELSSSDSMYWAWWAGGHTMTGACPATSIRSQNNILGTIWLYPISYLILRFIWYCHNKTLISNVFFDIEENPFYVRPDIQIWPSLPLNIGPIKEGFFQ